MKPLVSIIIPAFNAEATIAQTVHSAVNQTWPCKEVIVIDDGSSDRTLEIARRFESKGVRIETQENQGSSAARNCALSLSQGDYIQWLDHDDILMTDKIERQLLTCSEAKDPQILLSSAWAPFYYQTRKARFVHNALCQDLSPIEWLLHKMNGNLHMQTSTWLVSRELTEAAGPWDVRLLSDDDGEYFCRVLMAAKGTRFVPRTGVFWRTSGTHRLSNIGASEKKQDALLISMKLHIAYLGSLEQSERVRKACLVYLQTWYGVFYPERPDIVSELQSLAAQFNGELETPRLRWKYEWMRPLLGWKAAKWAQNNLPEVKTSWVRIWDRSMYALESARHRRRATLPLSLIDKPSDFEAGNLSLKSPRQGSDVHATGNMPLVSILIPAHNADAWIGDTLKSAVAQTWEFKEIIVVDDGSSDQTLAVARQFESDVVRVVGQENLGAAAARNHALRLSNGEFIQWLDADDLLAPDKIERQLAALREEDDTSRILLSSGWGTFFYRTERAVFTPSLLWHDLSPTEWLLAKLENNLHMQTATWLTSRALAEAAGPWDTRLLFDDDGEYFSRVLLASEGTRFVSGTGVYWRISGSQRLSYIGSSDKKKDALLLSMKLHVNYLRSLEESERVRKACLTYLRNWSVVFYPERPDLVAELEILAGELNGRLEVPHLRAQYQWISPLFGRRTAKWVQSTAPHLKAMCLQRWDKAMYRAEADKTA